MTFEARNYPSGKPRNHIAFRVSFEEDDQIEVERGRLELSVSDFMRLCIAEHFEKVNARD